MSLTLPAVVYVICNSYGLLRSSGVKQKFFSMVFLIFYIIKNIPWGVGKAQVPPNLLYNNIYYGKKEQKTIYSLDRDN